jgi:acyl-CoA thioesterase-1
MNDPWLDRFIYHIASGQAFFLGSALVLAGLLVSAVSGRGSLMVLRNLGVIVGGILVAVSATPLPYWLYGVVGCVSCIWLVLEWLRKKVPRRLLLSFRLAALVSWLLAVGMELPYHVTPSLTPLSVPALFVIGDSVTAGMGERTHDFSQMGATVTSAARKQAPLLGDDNGLVLLEIGGNDVLGRTTAAEFHLGLEQLLESVCRPGRTVVMFELPLPPACQ